MANGHQLTEAYLTLSLLDKAVVSGNEGIPQSVGKVVREDWVFHQVTVQMCCSIDCCLHAPMAVKHSVVMVIPLML